MNLPNKSLCLAPWVHLHALPDGNVFPCCSSAMWPEAKLGSLNESDLETVWNSEVLKDLRKKMINGERSSICRNCNLRDDAGLGSQRQYFEKTFSKHKDKIASTLEDGTVPNFELPFIDFRLSNLCNLTCNMCSGSLSSAWTQLETGSKGIIKIDVSKFNFKEQFSKLIPGLEQIHFSGGEPLIQPEHMWALSQLVEHKKNNVRITYNTNFTKLGTDKDELFRYWSNFNDVIITMSLDGCFEVGEYVRNGTVWAEIEKNIIEVKRRFPHFVMDISCIMTNTNVEHFPDFYRHMVLNDLVSPNSLTSYMLDGPSFLRINNASRAYKNTVIAKYKKFTEEFLPTVNHNGEIVRSVDLILKHLEQENDENLTDVKNKIDRLDALQRKSCKAVLPNFYQSLCS